MSEAIPYGVAGVVLYLFGAGFTAGFSARKGWNDNADAAYGLTTEGWDAVFGVLWPITLPVGLACMSLAPTVRLAYRLIAPDPEDTP